MAEVSIEFDGTAWRRVYTEEQPTTYSYVEEYSWPVSATVSAANPYAAPAITNDRYEDFFPHVDPNRTRGLEEIEAARRELAHQAELRRHEIEAEQRELAHQAELRRLDREYRAERLRLDREYREAYAARELKRIQQAELARTRARELLLSHLSAEQRAEFEAGEYFSVLVRGRTYRIYKYRNGNVYRIEGGDPTICYCAPTDLYVPIEDQMLAQKLMLEANEYKFVEVAVASLLY